MSSRVSIVIDIQRQIPGSMQTAARPSRCPSESGSRRITRPSSVTGATRIPGSGTPLPPCAGRVVRPIAAECRRSVAYRSRVHAIEIVLGLLVAVALTVTLARRVGVPYPILLVIGGLLLSLVPRLPHVELEPEIVFLVFLPPLLFAAGYFTSLRDFRANARPIGLLAIGLVLTTTLAVGVVAHTLIDGLSWPLAFALGAIVSPPDAIATTAIAQRLGLPRRIVVILEGESLVNDAT